MSNKPILEPGEYRLVQQQLFALAAILRELPLAQFLSAIDRAETTAPLFNPTLWLVGESKLAIIKQVARAMHEAQTKLPSLQQVLKAEERSKNAAEAAGVDPATMRPR